MVEVVDAVGVEAAGAPFDPMHHSALLQQQFRQIAAVLPGDAGDQGGFGCGEAGGYRLDEGAFGGNGGGGGEAMSLGNTLRDSVQTVRKPGQCSEGSCAGHRSANLTRRQPLAIAREGRHRCRGDLCHQSGPLCPLIFLAERWLVPQGLTAAE